MFLYLMGSIFTLWGQPSPAARNIILLIGDGMGVSQVSAGLYANDNFLQLESFQHIGLVKTHSAKDLITDSAAGATAMACGQKTYNGVLAMDTAGTPLKTILETVHERGLRTGLIATSTIQHATPAAFYAHQHSRTHYEDITLDLLKGKVDLVIGGGRRLFEDRRDGRNLLKELPDMGLQWAKNLKAASRVDDRKAPLFVLLEPGHLPPARKRPENFLANATQFAIDWLNQDQEGFFLMVEGSQIDWGGHSNDADHIVEEMIDFDKAVGQALEFARKDGNTLVIVTADHETGGFAVEGKSEENAHHLSMDFTTDNHTAAMVPLFAYGPGSAAFMGVYDNTRIYHKMMRAINVNEP